MHIEIECEARLASYETDKRFERAEFTFDIGDERYHSDEAGLQTPPDAVPPETVGPVYPVVYRASVTLTDDSVSEDVTVEATTMSAQLRGERSNGEFADHAFELFAADGSEWGRLYLPDETVDDPLARRDRCSVEIELEFDRETTLETNDCPEEMLDDLDS